MNRKFARWVAGIIASALILSVFATIIVEFVYAAPSVQQQIDAAQKKKDDAQKKLNAANQNKKKSLAEKERLERESVELQAQINGINSQIDETDKVLAAEQVKLDEATQKADTQYEVFQERFRIMCEQGDVSYIEMLLSAKNFTDFIDRAEVVKEISEYDKRVFDSMEKTRLEIEKSRDEIANLKKSQEAAKDNLETQKSALAAKQQEQANYIKELEKDAAAYQKVIDEEDRAMEALKAQVSSSLSKSSGGKAYVGGEFAWPTPSCHYITSHFSPRRKNPVSGIYKRHTGVDIGAGYGTTIVAANSGTVTLAGWNSGYGNCVIIDHGGGKATLYGHMSSYAVSKGQTVSKGQKIGAVGSTGNSTGPHLHFEILINGGAVNPMQYF